MAAFGYENPQLKRYNDPRTCLIESETWSSNATRYAEREEHATAAVFAQVAIAHAIEGLAAAILATGGFKGGGK